MLLYKSFVTSDYRPLYKLFIFSIAVKPLTNVKRFANGHFYKVSTVQIYQIDRDRPWFTCIGQFLMPVTKISKHS